MKSSPEVIFAEKEVNHKNRNAFHKKKATFEASSEADARRFLQNRPLSFPSKLRTTVDAQINCIISRYFCQYAPVISALQKALPPPPDRKFREHLPASFSKTASPESESAPRKSSLKERDNSKKRDKLKEVHKSVKNGQLKRRDPQRKLSPPLGSLVRNIELSKKSGTPFVPKAERKEAIPRCILSH